VPPISIDLFRLILAFHLADFFLADNVGTLRIDDGAAEPSQGLPQSAAPG
jgi:hypothetical protein